MSFEHKTVYAKSLMLSAAILLQTVPAFANGNARKAIKHTFQHTLEFKSKADKTLGENGARALSGKANVIQRVVATRFNKTKRIIREETSEADLSFVVAERGKERKSRPDDIGVHLKEPSESNGEVPGIRLSRGEPSKSFDLEVGSTLRGIAYQRRMNIYVEKQGKVRRNIKLLTRGYAQNPETGVVYEMVDFEKTASNEPMNGFDYLKSTAVRFYKHVDGKRVPISEIEYAKGMEDVPGIANSTHLYQDQMRPPRY